ncbi:transposase [SAR92 clade bacterium H455]|uniref:Transposase n=1 Tax=SAR92 clade bacterium H455 TaxID=2974818 RepID=A0ABY5TJZ0_9GAMM|nr:transposase [SAR92 clade bacterium H455]
MVITCGSLSDEAISKLCREKGIYPHHIKHWKSDFAEGKAVSGGDKKHADNKQLKHENKSLKKELSRKEKALAEAAALLVLQKKVNALWGNDEDSSQ